MSPLSSMTPSKRESYSDAATVTVPLARSTTPRESIVISTTGTSGSGSAIAMEPRMTIKPCGIEIITPIWAVSSGHGRTPADGDDRSDDRVPDVDGEVRVDLRDEDQRIPDRVVGEHDRVGGTLLETERQCFGVHPPVQRDDSTDAFESEPEAERDARDVDPETAEERPPFLAAGQLGVDHHQQADADLDDLQGRAAGVSTGVVVDVQEAATADDVAAVEREGHAVGKVDADFQREIVGRVTAADQCSDADARDRDLQRSDRGLGIDHDRQHQRPVVVDVGRDGNSADRDRADADGDGQLEREADVGAETKPLARQGHLHVQLGLDARDQAGHERVGAVGVEPKSQGLQPHGECEIGFGCDRRRRRQ